jgi:hypothetical protein
MMMDDPSGTAREHRAGAELACIETAAQTFLEEDTFPVDCPYSWDSIMHRELA